MPRAFLSFTVSAVTRNLLSSTRNTSKARQTTEGFITIQVPYFMEMPQQSPEFLDHQYNGLFTKIITHVPRGTIFAHYASIERVELLVLPIDRSSSVATSCEGNTEANAPSTWESSATSTGRRIKWTMATTSDAGGKIPSCVQRSWLLGGIPKAVVADVGLFIGWIVKKRRPSSARQEGEPEQEQDI